MIQSIGLDLVETARIEKDLEKYGERFVARILGASELELYNQRRDKAIFLAGRFAAKEAVIKALGAFIAERPAYSQIQVINDSTGRPQLHLSDEVRQRLPGTRCHISITHEKSHAAAVAVFEEEK